MDSMEKICTMLGCNIGDVMEFIPDVYKRQPLPIQLMIVGWHLISKLMLLFQSKMMC